MKLALLLLLASAVAPPAQAAVERLVELGPSRAQRDSSAPVLDFPFIARADEELASAQVRLAFAPGESDAPIDALEVLVNDERVAMLTARQIAGAGEKLDLPVRRELLSDRNQLSLKLRDSQGRCAARAGVWRSVRSIAVLLQANPVPLPNELALLPIPFFDRGYDTAATIPVVLARDPSPDDLRVAGLVAGWLGVQAPIPLSFEAHVGALPETRAVVLVAGEEDAVLLGIPPPIGPSVRMEDHPNHPASNVKLLVIGGRNPAELRAAAESLAARTGRLAGQEAMLPPPPRLAPAQPYSAPRWVPSDRRVSFAEYPEGAVPSHDGDTPATLAMRFRVAPDLWMWPAEQVMLELGWSERVPQGVVAPRLDVELNGYFLATLPQPRGAGESHHRVELPIPREHMRGFNELFVHIHYPEPDPCAAAAAGSARGDGPRVAIDGDSVLHIEGKSHFASLPDVSKFAFDGFPFSRVPDLGETAIALPARPATAELSTLLSILGQLAQVTGRVGTRATFLDAARASDADLRDKDLLVIGSAEDNRLVQRWQAALPIAIDAGRAHVQRPDGARALLDLLGGVTPLLDQRRASLLLSQASEVFAIAGIESPLSGGRSAIVVTGTSPQRLPPYGEFLGYAESRTGAGDLLVLAGKQRAMFRIGSAFGAGRLDTWTQVRWFLANHWVALLPVLLLCAAVLAWEAKRFITQTMRGRLALASAITSNRDKPWAR